MASSPSSEARTVFVLDSDVLIQLFKSCGVGPLRWIRSEYSLTSVVTSAVDVEMRWHGRYKDRFDKPMQKAIDSGVIRVADQLWARERVVPAAAADSVFLSYEQLGASMAKHVGSGEAYTHALANTFGLTAVSNDKSAFPTLIDNGFTIASTPVLRFFDLIALAHQGDHLDAGMCNSLCRELRAEDEGLPSEFSNNSFENGMKTFVPRIFDATRPLVGNSGIMSETVGIAARMEVRPISKT